MTDSTKCFTVFEVMLFYLTVKRSNCHKTTNHNSYVYCYIYYGNYLSKLVNVRSRIFRSFTQLCRKLKVYSHYGYFILLLSLP